MCPIYCTDSLWYLTVDSRLSCNFWISKATSIFVLGNFIKRLDFLRRVLQNPFTIWETVDLPIPKILETTLYEFPVDNRHKAQATHSWMLIVFRKQVSSFVMSASTKLTMKSNGDFVFVFFLYLTFIYRR